MQPDNPPSAEEWKMIADHLQLVFKKETPVRVSHIDPYRQGVLQQSLGQVITTTSVC